MSTNATTTNRPRTRLAQAAGWLRPAGSRGWLGPAIAGSIVVGLLGFLIGVSVGRPSWPGDDSADAGFARDMSSHHAQAVEMGMIAYQRATNDDVRSLGYDIAVTQQGQIGIMQTWLDTWGVPRNSTDPPMSWVPGGERMLNGNLMPGMATREEVGQLMEATGEQVDILFLQYMLRHHQGGIHMVNELLARDPSPPVRELAEGMKTGQQKEVLVLQDLLRQFGASPLPA